jgi:hypothetical protein
MVENLNQRLISLEKEAEKSPNSDLFKKEQNHMMEREISDIRNLVDTSKDEQK